MTAAKIMPDTVGPENGGHVTIAGPNGEQVKLELEETPGFWFDSPTHGRIWVRTFEVKSQKKE